MYAISLSQPIISKLLATPNELCHICQATTYTSRNYACVFGFGSVLSRLIMRQHGCYNFMLIISVAHVDRLATSFVLITRACMFTHAFVYACLRSYVYVCVCGRQCMCVCARLCRPMCVCVRLYRLTHVELTISQRSVSYM